MFVIFTTWKLNVNGLHRPKPCGCARSGSLGGCATVVPRIESVIFFKPHPKWMLSQCWHHLKKHPLTWCCPFLLPQPHLLAVLVSLLYAPPPPQSCVKCSFILIDFLLTEFPFMTRACSLFLKAPQLNVDGEREHSKQLCAACVKHWILPLIPSCLFLYTSASLEWKQISLWMYSCDCQANGWN